MQYDFLVKEINYGSITVEADNYAKAEALANELYNSGQTCWGNVEYDLEPEDLPPEDSLAGVRFAERVDSNSITTLFFDAPLPLLQQLLLQQKSLFREYPDAVSADLSIHFPTDSPSPSECICRISPVCEMPDGWESYDWTDIILTDEEIEFLFDLAGIKTKTN